MFKNVRNSANDSKEAGNISGDDNNSSLYFKEDSLEQVLRRRTFKFIKASSHADTKKEDAAGCLFFSIKTLLNSASVRGLGV